MCGRYTLRLQAEELADQLALPMDDGFDWQPGYNIAPSQMIPAVILKPEKTLTLLQWGLIPHWMKPKPDGTINGFINARSETAAQKPSFRTAFLHKRCLILADGFYEWKKLGGNTKQPMYFTTEDQRLLTFAGLWSTWTSPTEETRHTCTILTTQPNSLVKEAHDRMPVILPPDRRELWLEADDPGLLQSVLSPFPADQMIAYPVSKHVNNARFNDPICVQPITTLL
ncbi:MAG: SOS response-associated peptidase [Anaerolineae bacterium]|jgi:putative SOS response-associated peptidase YedK|nr:SOS response-associated peptidase [Anaerolineae bacterium]